MNFSRQWNTNKICYKIALFLAFGIMIHLKVLSRNDVLILTNDYFRFPAEYKDRIDTNSQNKSSTRTYDLDKNQIQILKTSRFIFKEGHVVKQTYNKGKVNDHCFQYTLLCKCFQILQIPFNIVKCPQIPFKLLPSFSPPAL